LSDAALPDGLTALRAELKLGEVMRLIECTARWVDPETFRLLPLWYPEHARGAFFYKKNWSDPQMNKNRQTGHTEHKREGNLYANKALTHALGLRSDDRPNWSCCHIWGIDDALYQESNAVVQDRRFYSCVANMVLLPMPLKAFTDTMLEVEAMLRICARKLYGWHCDHTCMADGIAKIDGWDDWDAYPESWPREHMTSLPRGVMKLDDGIRQSATRRLEQIRTDLEKAGIHYPREEVRAALAYWQIFV
jgi:hypothetical protein